MNKSLFYLFKARYIGLLSIPLIFWLIILVNDISVSSTIQDTAINNGISVIKNPNVIIENDNIVTITYQELIDKINNEYGTLIINNDNYYYVTSGSIDVTPNIVRIDGKVYYCGEC